MLGRWVRWNCVLAIAVAFAMAGPASAQTAAEADKLNAKVVRLYRAGKYAEAIPIAQQVLVLRQKALGRNNPSLAPLLNNLALLYKKVGRYAEAEPLYKRSIAIAEKSLGPNHPDVAQSLNNLAELYVKNGKSAKAEPLHKRALAIRKRALGPNHPDVAVSLDNLAAVYLIKGRYDEAEPLFKQALAIREKAFGRNHRDVALSLNNLAELYANTGRYAKAEPLLRRALVIWEKAGGPNHPEAAHALNNLAALYVNTGRYVAAEPLYKRALAIREKAFGPNHPDVALALDNLAGLYKDQGLYTEAEPLFKRALAIRKKAFKPNHPDVALSLNNLAALYKVQGLYVEAEPLFKRALAVREKAFGPNHPNVALSLNNLAALYQDQGHLAEAEPLYKWTVTIYEKAIGPNHPDVALALNNLAALLQDQGRLAEAEPLYKRTITIYEKALGPNHPHVATALNNLASLYNDQGRYAEAEPLDKRALAIQEKAFGPNHPNVATTLGNLAFLYKKRGRVAEAEPLYKRTITIYEKAFGPNHPDVALALNNLAALLQDQHRLAEAELLHKRALAIREKALGPDHPDVAASLNNLAWIALEQGDFSGAAGQWRKAGAIFQDYAERELSDVSRASSESERGRSRVAFQGLVKTMYRLAASKRDLLTRAAPEIFETAQWGLASDAAAALAAMAARSAKGLPDLAALVRERQDLVAEWQRKDKLLVAARSKLPAKRNAVGERVLSERLAAIDARLAAIDAHLARDFPDYAALASPKPISIADVQTVLHEDEVLVFFLDTGANWTPLLPEETFVWIVSKRDVRWVRSELGTKALSDEVAALRCGLDATSWDDASDWSAATEELVRQRTAQIARRQRCEKLLKAKPTTELFGLTPVQVLPFDHARAYRLYTALFGEVQDLIKGKQLLIVPSGPLTQLPFQVLITEPPSNGQKDKSAAWLIRSHALTMLPAVSSLKALRRVAKPSAAAKPMIGFGNPLLEGDQDDVRYGAYYKGLATSARERQACPVAQQQEVASLRSGRRWLSPLVTHRGLAELAHLKAQIPLPETANELCWVARDLGADPREIRLGARATESEIKALSRSGALAQFRIVHFATHGTLAGQLSGTTEPGLILTPPTSATEEDDGYLSASEIAALKLDADWVILSACNTAAAGASSAEALSGLARAFFYAQARALLVSHWEVNSAATVKLITAAVDEIRRASSVGRAEALRRAMLALIHKGQPYEAHPSFWAPFVVVGEGAAAR